MPATRKRSASTTLSGRNSCRPPERVVDAEHMCRNVKPSGGILIHRGDWNGRRRRNHGRLVQRHRLRRNQPDRYLTNIVSSGLSTLGTVTNVATGPSFTTNVFSTAAAEAQNACYITPPPRSPICPMSVTLNSSNIHEQPLSLDAPEYLTGVGILTEMDLAPIGGISRLQLSRKM
jgi:hypothetical protein